MSDKTIYDKLNLINQETDKIKTMLVNSKQLTAEEATLENIPPAIQTLIEAGGGSVEANPYEQLYMQRTSNETNMKGLFYYCNTPELDLTGLDTSKVTDMGHMFSNCTSQINVNGWDTSKVTNAMFMFEYFTNNSKYIDLSVIDFSNVTIATNIFSNCNLDNIDIRNINLDLTKVGLSSSSNGPQMFYQAKGTLDLSNWYLDSSITSLRALCHWFYGTAINLTNWNTTNVTNMHNIFYYNSNLEKLIMPDWDMTNVTNTTNFFYNCSKLNYIDLSRSNDATIEKIATLVPAKTLATYGQILIPVDSSQANIEAVAAKYWKPVGPRIDLTSCEIMPELDEIKPGKSTKLYYGNNTPWYGNDVGVEYISSNESVAIIDGNIITSTGIEGTTEITARNIDTQEVISEPKVFSVSETDNYPNVIKFRGTNAPTSNNYIYVNGTSSSNKVLLSAMNYNPVSGIYTYDVGAPITSIRFNGYGSVSSYSNTCTEVVKINISNMTSMQYMLGYTDITSLDVSSFDTSNVTDMRYMFRYCQSLTSLDISNFDTSNVTDMGYMFDGCEKLTSLDLSNFDTSKVTSINAMFRSCDSLHTLRLDNCNNNTISKIIKSGNFPTGVIQGITRTIYCKEGNAAGLTPPTNWKFEYIE